jgi:hypothetical protein
MNAIKECKHGVREDECQRCVNAKRLLAHPGTRANGKPRLRAPLVRVGGMRGIVMPGGTPCSQGVAETLAPRTLPEEPSAIELLRRTIMAMPRDTFTKEDLTVAAWRQHKPEFGLRGFTDYHPDARKVQCMLYGPKGAIARGWLSICDVGSGLLQRKI